VKGLTTFVGLEIHESTIAVVLARGGKQGEVIEHKLIANTPSAIKALATKLTRTGLALRFCYEAGPCGFGVYQQLVDAGYECVVVAPPLDFRNGAERRNAAQLAVLHRAGALTAVSAPAQTQDAMHYLMRARLATVSNLRRARQPLACFRNLSSNAM
jgi:transposase